MVAIKNLSGFVEADKDGNWSCPTDKKHKHEIFPNPVCGLTTTSSVHRQLQCIAVCYLFMSC